ncbi:MAG: hypothetical protein RLZZ350_1866 [Verrucomicrobiota bacterium]|jgi:hypothetical protein
MKTKLLALLLAFATTLPAFGWGDSGHRIVALIAQKYLNAKAAAAAKQMLPGQTLADVATFADHYRNFDTNSGPWHYVDIPLTATSYDQARDCTAHHGCLLDQLEIFKQQVTDPKLTASNRVFALKFIVHLVGDLHQPLHCEDNDDHGGNQLKVTLFSSGAKKSAKLSNLHSAWDSGLIKHTGFSDEQYAELLTAKLQPMAITTLQSGTAVEWAMQSHAFAKLAYQIPASHDLDEAYFHKMKPALDTSLLRGGLRLARMLNETVGK